MRKIILIAFLLISSAMYAQEDEIGGIATDRPVQSETPTVVPRGYVQIENGIFYERGIGFECPNTGTSRTDQLNYNLLLKYGLIKNLELRYNFDYLSHDYMLNNEKESSESGVSGPNVGLKYSILSDEKGNWKPNLSLSVHSQLNIYGNEEFTPDYSNVAARLTAGKNLTQSWYAILGYQLNYADNASWRGSFFVFQTGYSINNLTLIAEFYGQKNENIDLDQSAFNGALVYLINTNHQVDVSFGKGMYGDWYDYYLALGYSLRFNP